MQATPLHPITIHSWCSGGRELSGERRFPSLIVHEFEVEGVDVAGDVAEDCEEDVDGEVDAAARDDGDACWWDCSTS
jgi:hypothetical protein